MRKVILYIAMSLDGYIADSDGKIDWLDLNVTNPEKDTSYEDFYKDVDSVVMGRKTFDQVTQELSPDCYPYEGKSTYVFTHENRESTKTVKYLSGDISEYISAMKKEQGKDIWIVGGAAIINPLIREDLIDVYKIAILPVILGKGIPLFEQLERPRNLVAKSTYIKNQLSYISLEKS